MLSGSGPITPPLSSAAKVVLRLGSVQPGAMPTLHEVSGASAVLTSSACPPSPRSAAGLPVLGAEEPRLEEPLTGVPAMSPEAISWRTSLAVIGDATPLMRVQPLAALSFVFAFAGQPP